MVKLISSSANSSEINGLATRSIDAILNANTKDEIVTILVGKMKTANDNLTVAINRKTGNDSTDLINSLGAKRKKGLKSFFKTVNGATFHLVPEVEAAGEKLMEVIKRHGKSMYRLPQDQLTSAMASMFKELEQPDLVAAMELTSTKSHLEETKKANMDYLSELGKSISAVAEKEDTQLVQNNMKDVKLYFDKIMHYLDAYLAAKENPALYNLNAGLGDMIDKANAIIKSRNTRKGNGNKNNGESKLSKKNDAPTEESKKE